MAPSHEEIIMAQDVPPSAQPICSDPLVVLSEDASDLNKKLWWLHGHPHSKRYADPGLTSFDALIRWAADKFEDNTAFLCPGTTEDPNKIDRMTWRGFDSITDWFAAHYAKALAEELQAANVGKKQPTVGLIGRGISIEYFVTEFALQKLGVRVLLLAESNAVHALHHLLDSCDACAVITDSRNTDADTKGLRKLVMLERATPGAPTCAPTCTIAPGTERKVVEELRYNDDGDVWERHSFIIHSSGSTGLPKPIIHTNRSMMLIARMYRLFPDIVVKNWFLLFPLYHIAGISTAISGIPNGQVLSFPPLDWPPSSSSLLASWNTLSRAGYPVDIVHCAPTLIENLHNYILEETRDYTPLSALKVLQPGGAALSSSIVDSLVAHNVNVKTTYGSTEIGPPFRTMPHSVSDPSCYSFRSLYPDNPLLQMEEVGEGLYECIVYPGFELAAELWSEEEKAKGVNGKPYRTNDLFMQEPEGSGWFVLVGRKDDMLIHSNGENTKAGPVQLDVQASCKVVEKVLAVGHSKPVVALLVEVSEDCEMGREEVEKAVWKTVNEVNAKLPGHSRVMRSMICLLKKGQKLPVTPKGNVKRKEAMETYKDEIEKLYAGIEGSDSGPETKIAPAGIETEPPLEFLRKAFADIAGVEVEKVKDDTTLYSLGIDSRQALALRGILAKRFGNVSLGAIFESPTIESLLAYLDRKGLVKGANGTGVVQREDSANDRYQVTSKIISKLEEEFDSWPVREISTTFVIPEKETVVLTGASGSLGTSLLEALSRSAKVEKVYALIRGPKSQEKLVKSFERRGLSAETIMANGKIEVLNYSMEDPLLGLDVDVYAKLAKEVTIVLHNAWKMDFNPSVEQFEDCLRGTMHLLRLSHAGNPARFAFTSSVSTCLGPSSPASIAESAIGPSPSSALPTGYAQSKYIVERLTQTASQVLSLPTTLLRVGQLCGNTKTGHWNTDEMWPIMFSTSASSEMKAVPVLDGMGVDWVPVDVAGRAIVEILTDAKARNVSGPVYEVFNVVNPNPISWIYLVQMLQKSGLAKEKMEEVAMKDWVKRLERLGPDSKVQGLRLLGFFEDMAAEEGSENKVFETEKGKKVSSSLRELKAFNQEWIERSVRKWREDGFLE